MTGPSPKHSVNKIPSLNVGRDNIQHGANLRHLIKDTKTLISDNYGYLLASERSKRDTLRSVQLRIADIL